MKAFGLPFICAVFIVFATPAALHASEASARAFVEKLSGDVLSTIRTKDMTEKQKAEKLEGVFRDSVDTSWMGRFVMGKYYRQMDAAQKKSYNDLYADFLIYSYIPRFKTYTNEGLDIVNIRKEGSDEYFVQTKIVRANEPDIMVDYRLKTFSGKYKIIDIIGEGISLITTQRSDFSGLISRKGLEEFIEKLDGRVKNMRNSAVYRN
jgi:phospholipid transport system substrate-binding protein